MCIRDSTHGVGRVACRLLDCREPRALAAARPTDIGKPSENVGSCLLYTSIIARHLEAIADAVHGVDPARIARVVADLCTEVLHVTVDGALVALEIIAEDQMCIRDRGTSPSWGDGNRVLMLVHCRSVHSFGMRYALDIAFVDKAGAVLRSERNVKPGRLLSCRNAAFVLERPHNCLLYTSRCV